MAIKSKFLKKLLVVFVIAIFGLTLLLQADNAKAQSCNINEIRWAQNTIPLGQTAKFTVRSTDCLGSRFPVEIWRQTFFESKLVETVFIQIPSIGLAVGDFTPKDSYFRSGQTTTPFSAQIKGEIIGGGHSTVISGVLSVTRDATEDDDENGNGNGGSDEGETQIFKFKLDNPIEADNFIELINVLATWLLNIAIPIAVAMIVWAGVKFLTSRGEPGEVTKAKQILLYAVVGLSIILIGKGFITFIESILDLGSTP